MLAAALVGWLPDRGMQLCPPALAPPSLLAALPHGRAAAAAPAKRRYSGLNAAARPCGGGSDRKRVASVNGLCEGAALRRRKTPQMVRSAGKKQCSARCADTRPCGGVSDRRTRGPLAKHASACCAAAPPLGGSQGRLAQSRAPGASADPPGTASPRPARQSG